MKLEVLFGCTALFIMLAADSALASSSVISPTLLRTLPAFLDGVAVNPPTRVSYTMFFRNLDEPQTSYGYSSGKRNDSINETPFSALSLGVYNITETYIAADNGPLIGRTYGPEFGLYGSADTSVNSWDVKVVSKTIVPRNGLDSGIGFAIFANSIFSVGKSLYNIDIFHALDFYEDKLTVTEAIFAGLYHYNISYYLSDAVNDAANDTLFVDDSGSPYHVTDSAKPFVSHRSIAPEPPVWVLMMVGVGAVGMMIRRKTAGEARRISIQHLTFEIRRWLAAKGGSTINQIVPF